MEDIKDIIELRRNYQETFRTASGRIVLQDILLRGNFFNEHLSRHDPEDIGKRNMVTEIVKIIGAYNSNPERVTEAITNCLLNQPITDKQEEDGD